MDLGPDFGSFRSGSSPREATSAPLNNQGHDLLADSRVVWSLPASPRPPASLTAKRPFGCGVSNPSLLLTGDGKTVVCGASGVFRAPGSFSENEACPAIPAWNDEGVLEYSVATGKVSGTLYRGQSNCVPTGPVQLLWTSDSGDTAIGAFQFCSLTCTGPTVKQFGLFTAGRFTPLPAPPTIRTDPTTTAW